MHASKYKLTEESGVVSEGQLSASSTDVAPTATEVNSNNSESKNTALVNENKDSLVNNCEQQKSIDNHKESNFTDKPDQMKAERENGRWEDVLWSTVDINLACGKAERLKENSEDRSSQSSDELETVGAAGGDKPRTGANCNSAKIGLSQTGSASQDRSVARFSTGGQTTRNYPGAPDDQSRKKSESEDSERSTVDETINICIPFTNIFANEQTVTEDNVENVRSPYKLIDGFPSNTDIRKRKSYTMSFSRATNNAEWVYEILNSETLEDNCKNIKPFRNDYHKGHLAAAANHRWCQEAKNDANLFSNIIPQHKKLNQGMWKKLENHCRRIQRVNSDCNVHVYTGPLYLRETNDRYHRMHELIKMNIFGNKVIPTHLFKVIIVENEDGTVKEPKCYLIPNKETESKDLDDYRLQHDDGRPDIEFIERASGLNFIQHHPNVNMRDHIKTVTLHGEHVNQESCSVDITLRISS
ncbi:hypothetical protein QQF64_026034 [Cirrhinus molitorella]|uniref:Endonuclease G, mitochondrial n=1 Tax=Cirrhinus molitorella TaxID=172907 RepID=A0ABR3NRE8_9TELE